MNPQWANSPNSNCNAKRVSYFKASQDRREPKALFVSAAGPSVH